MSIILQIIGGLMTGGIVGFIIVKFIMINNKHLTQEILKGLCEPMWKIGDDDADKKNN